MRKHLRLLLSLVLSTVIWAVALSSVACDTPQINRAIAIAKTVPGLVQSLHLSNEADVLKYVNEIIADAEIFRDNPTVGNLQTAISVTNHALTSGIFKVSPALQGVVAAIQTLLASIVPPKSVVASVGTKVNIKDLDKDKVDALDEAVRKLKREAGK